MISRKVCKAGNENGDVGWPGLRVEDLVFRISKFPNQIEAEGAEKKELIFPSTCFIIATDLIDNT